MPNKVKYYALFHTKKKSFSCLSFKKYSFRLLVVLFKLNSNSFVTLFLSSSLLSRAHTIK